MGGTIGVSSQQGHGSLFCFTIGTRPGEHPLTPKNPEKATIDQPTQKFALTYPWKILLAEDDPINQFVATAILQRFGYQPVVAVNGAEAIEMWTKDHYELILMDVQMPGTDGMEATRTIRQAGAQQANNQPPNGQQPIIIAMTANALQGDREDCLDAGMNDYISKPFDPQELLALLVKWSPTATREAPR
jgi:CheY-like chemotaxis protein